MFYIWVIGGVIVGAFGAGAFFADSPQEAWPRVVMALGVFVCITAAVIAGA